MLVFWGAGKPEYSERNLSEQSREPTNSTHIWRRIWESNPGHVGGRRVLSLHLPIFDFLYSFPGSFNVVFFHKGVHRGQFDLSTKVRIHTAIGHSGILEISRGVTQLITNKGKKLDDWQKALLFLISDKECRTYEQRAEQSAYFPRGLARRIQWSNLVIAHSRFIIVLTLTVKSKSNYNSIRTHVWIVDTADHSFRSIKDEKCGQVSSVASNDYHSKPRPDHPENAGTETATVSYTHLTLPTKLEV